MTSHSIATEKPKLHLRVDECLTRVNVPHPSDQIKGGSRRDSTRLRALGALWLPRLRYLAENGKCNELDKGAVMDELVKRQRRPPDDRLTCQGAIVPWPRMVRGDDGKPFRPRFPLWLNVETGLVYTDPDGLLSAHQDPLHAALEALLRFVEQLAQQHARPQRIEVRDPELAEYLRRHTADRDLDVHLKDRLPALEAAVADLTRSVESRASGPPSLLDSRGVAIERIRAFADAAAEFYRAAPWRYLSDSDLFEVESPKPPRGMTCFVVLGAARSAFGLGFYPDRRSYECFLRAGRDGEYGTEIAAGLSQVIFDCLDDMPDSDAILWAEHGLPVAGDQAYPLVMKYGRSGAVSPARAAVGSRLRRRARRPGRTSRVAPRRTGPLSARNGSRRADVRCRVFCGERGPFLGNPTYSTLHAGPLWPGRRPSFKRSRRRRNRALL
jgi:hypothetical protein